MLEATPLGRGHPSERATRPGRPKASLVSRAGGVQVAGRELASRPTLDRTA